MRKILIAGALALAMTPLAIAGLASAKAPNPQGGSGTLECNRDGVLNTDGTISWSPTQLWPPNHKPVEIGISYNASDDSGDTTHITVDGVVVVGDTTNGAGKPTNVDWTYDDATETAGDDSGENPAHAGTLKVLSERSGHDIGGRTYLITATCTDAGPTSPVGDRSETTMFCVSVPHDQHHPIVQDKSKCLGEVVAP